MKTSVTLEGSEFSEFNIGTPTSATFCLKEVKAIIAFVDFLGEVSACCRLSEVWFVLFGETYSIPDLSHTTSAILSLSYHLLLQPFRLCFTSPGKPLIFSTGRTGIHSDFVLATLLNNGSTGDTPSQAQAPSQLASASVSLTN